MRKMMTRIGMTRMLGLIHPLALLIVLLGLLLAGTTTAQAANVANDKAPISGPFANPCNGEPLTFSGDVHTLVHATADSSGGSHADFHQNFQGVSGLGASGTTYSIPVIFNDRFNFTNGAQEHTFTEHVGVISHGSAPNFELIETLHITVTLNRDVTSFHDHFEAACRG
jgi:hypothetical protein